MIWSKSPGRMSSNPLSQQPQLQSIRVGWFSLVTNNNFKMVLPGQRTDFYGMLATQWIFWFFLMLLFHMFLITYVVTDVAHFLLCSPHMGSTEHNWNKKWTLLWLVIMQGGLLNFLPHGCKINCSKSCNCKISGTLLILLNGVASAAFWLLKVSWTKRA